MVIEGGVIGGGVIEGGVIGERSSPTYLAYKSPQYPPTNDNTLYLSSNSLIL